jgi:hypothetical protein
MSGFGFDGVGAMYDPPTSALDSGKLFHVERIVTLITGGCDALPIIRGNHDSTSTPDGWIAGSPWYESTWKTHSSGRALP